MTKSHPVLDVVIKKELVRVRTQPNLIDFARALVVDIDLHRISGEHLSLEQKLMISLERIKRLIERSGSRRDFGALERRQVVKVFVDGVPWADPALDAVKARHEHRRERQIGIAGGIRT